MKPFARVLVGGLFALLIGEAALYVAGVSYPIFETVDPVLGAALIPGAQGWQMREGHAYVRINTHGFRDHERSKHKPPGTFRIAVLGDSFTEARQVNLQETFCAILEKELDCRRPFGSLEIPDIEVLNFGVSGYGTTQQWLLLHHRIWDYEPDVVLLAVFTGNDIADNSPSLTGNDALPYYIYRNGALVLDRSFLSSKAYQFRDSWAFGMLRRALHFSRVLQVINYWRLVRNLETRRSKESEKGGLAVFLEPGLREELYREPLNADWSEAWRVTEGLITRMHREVEQKRARFLVVTLSNGIQVHPDASYRKEFMDRTGVEDLFYPDRRIRALGEREAFSVLTLAPALQACADMEQAFLHGFDSTLGLGHWNATGHRMAGRLIGRWMAEDVLSNSKYNGAGKDTAPGQLRSGDPLGPQQSEPRSNPGFAVQ